MNIRHARVVVVEDDPLWRDQLKELLNSLGCESIVHSGNTKKLRSFLRNSNYDLFVVDIELDRLKLNLSEGLVLAKIVRESHKSVPIIAVSGYDNSEIVRIAFYEIRVIDFIFKKRWDDTHFLSLVRRALGESLESYDLDDLASVLTEKLKSLVEGYSDEMKESVRQMTQLVAANRTQTALIFSEITEAFERLHNTEQIVEEYFLALTEKDALMKSKVLLSISLIPGILQIRKEVDLEKLGDKLKERYDQKTLPAYEKLWAVYRRLLALSPTE